MIAADIDWASAPLNVASTAATVEVDCCQPFLTRNPAAHANGGGPFASYIDSMKALGADFVRFAPWVPYPKVSVLELTPSDCTAEKPATNWNSTLFDPVLADFMGAVCGPDAALGTCEHSVAQQISTMPSWMYVGGDNVSSLPANPWVYAKDQFDIYSKGSALVDESCVAMADYVARVVGHYTAGGHNDSCGHWHLSGLHYNWSVIAVLNENEHGLGAKRYTTCFDAIRSRVEAINPTVVLAGPETVVGPWGITPSSFDYTEYFIDPANHADGRAPATVSNHFFSEASGPLLCPEWRPRVRVGEDRVPGAKSTACPRPSMRRRAQRHRFRGLLPGDRRLRS